MVFQKKIVWFLLMGLVSCQTLSPREPREENWAQKSVSSQNMNVNNLWQVSDELYRSEQPNSENLPQIIDYLGVKTLINLRTVYKDNEIAHNQNITLIHLPLIAGELTQDELAKAVYTIQKSPKPVLLHCRHGSDRTGAVIAAYRIAVQGWTPEKAADELAFGGYGYHYVAYPNIKKLILSIQPHVFKQQVNAIQ